MYFLLYNKNTIKATAKSNKQINYSYDSLRRVKKVEYADGTVVDYIYDKNGNIKSVNITHTNDSTEKKTEESSKTEGSTEKKTEDSTNTETTTEKKLSTEEKNEGADKTEKTTEDKTITDNKTEESTDKEKPTEEKNDIEEKVEESKDGDKSAKEQASTDDGKEGNTDNNITEKTTETDKTTDNENIENKTEGKGQPGKETGNKAKDQIDAETGNDIFSETETDGENINSEEIAKNTPIYTVDELGIINAFKRSMPIIKSLKNISKKGVKYLSIKITKIKKKDEIKTIGFEIRYSKKKNFKGYKKLTVNQSDRKKYVTKKFKVSKNKTYYVKARAFAKTKSGKKIYSKFSKIKKIKVGK